jgi:hypothetical protein
VIARRATGATGYAAVTVGHRVCYSTAVSMLDRLLHHATVVVTDGESLR